VHWEEKLTVRAEALRAIALWYGGFF